MNKENRINQYQENYLSQYGFEAEMVKYRRKLVIERLDTLKPRTVVEVGCGSELLYQHYLQVAGDVDCWIIVEPGSEFYGIAAASGLPNLKAIHGFFEDSIQQIGECLPTPPDMIIISCLLHEVASAIEFLKAAHSIMGEQSVLHVNVPNATSFHRMLAKSMGLIGEVKELSNRDIKFMHNRVYDANSLRYDVQAADLVPIKEGGYFIKPFTHAQMELVTPVIGDKFLDGLYSMGKELPNLASEIYIEASRSR